MAARRWLAIIVLLAGLWPATAPAETHDSEAAFAEITTLYRQGRFHDALPLVEAALAESEARNGPYHPITASLLNTMALLYKSLGRFDEAGVGEVVSLRLQPLRVRRRHVFDEDASPRAKMQHPPSTQSQPSRQKELHDEIVK